MFGLCRSQRDAKKGEHFELSAQLLSPDDDMSVTES
jgi:hypothetical protein